LQLFMLSQADVLYRDSYKKIASGNPTQIAIGVKNLALYASALAIVTVPSDAIKDWLNTGDLKLDKIDYVDNFIRNFGLNRYSTDQVSLSSHPGRTMLEQVQKKFSPPALSTAVNLGNALSEPKKLVPYVPVVGRILYNREFGGNLEKEIAETRARNRHLQLSKPAGVKLLHSERQALSDAAKQYLKDRKEAQK